MPMTDDSNQESVSITVDTSIRSSRLVWVFEQIRKERPLPDVLRVDNGPEYLGEVFTNWCTEHGAFIDCIEPGKSNQNAFY